MEGITTVTGSRTWHLAPHDPGAIQQLARELRVWPLVAQLLLNRRLDHPERARNFLDSPLKGLHEPELLPGVPEAVALLQRSLAEQRPICIWGDYDVDGTSGTAILLTCLRLLGAVVEFHVPDRLTEGYGLNPGTLADLARRGFKTIVTVDCGIACPAEAEEARRLGLDLIITDHHEHQEDLPRAAALVHPRLPVGSNGSTRRYPFGHLCGAGVAFKLAWALCKAHCGSAKVTPPLREFLLDAIALAALGTVADVVPLFEENRILVRHGLHRLQQRPSIGLQALLKIAKLHERPRLEAANIGYALAPRLNAVGRLSSARQAVELLTTGDPAKALELADLLENHNLRRQDLERRIFQEARGLAEQMSAGSALVLASADWHPGLLGIVASRLVDRFGRPVLMVSLPQEADGPARGSGRSVPGFKLHEALQECGRHLLGHGGHAAAAGFRLQPSALESFRAAFQSVAQRILGVAPPPPRLHLDAEVPLSVLTSRLLQDLEQLEPFGAGNPQPVLLADRLRIVGEPKVVGVGQRHVRLRLRQEGRTLPAIGFNLADRLPEWLSADGWCSIAFTPRFNEWNGQRWIELEIRDFQAGPEPRLG